MAKSPVVSKYDTILHRVAMSEQSMKQSGKQPGSLSAGQVSTHRPGTRWGYGTYVSLGLVLVVYASYLIFYSGIFHSSDAKFIVAATESMVKRAEFTTSQLWWHQDAIETVAPDIGDGPGCYADQSSGNGY
jgi:hypothetical protein